MYCDVVAALEEEGNHPGLVKQLAREDGMAQRPARWSQSAEEALVTAPWTLDEGGGLATLCENCNCLSAAKGPWHSSGG